MRATSCSIGVDIGGTFTDFALFDDGRRLVHTHKLLTTPGDPSRAVIDGVRTLLEKACLLALNIDRVVHGTTLVTNAVIERKGAPTAMLVTKGFRDTLDIGFERRYDLFDLRIRFPTPIVPRQLRIEVPERMGHDGRTVVEPDFDSVHEAIQRTIDQYAVEAIAVCFLHSYADPRHERAAVRWLAERFPRLSVTASAEVYPFVREYERWTTACVNAYVSPLVDRYLARLQRGLEELGFRGKFHVMSSSGSTLSPEVARRFPVRLLESGPAAGALMSATYGRALGLPQLLSFDMGGTTTKGCIVQGGQPLKNTTMEVARVHEFKKGSGLPIRIPVIDMIEIGTGGGSIAHIDARGTLRVGPRSAGADPGPACYGLGGRHPTLTDANLVLGYLGAKSFLGGRMPLDMAGAREAIEHGVARPLGVGLERAAWGIHEVINEDVSRAFRVHASERGVDYRRCSMVAFGGSGPMHAVGVARKLKIPRVVCPVAAGVMSAFGLLSSPIGFEVMRTWRVKLNQLTTAAFATEFNRLKGEAAGYIADSGVAPAQMQTVCRLDMRYVGQGYEVEVDLPPNWDASVFTDLATLFHTAYRRVFGLHFEDREIEISSWKIDVRVPQTVEDSAYTLAGTGGAENALKGRRLAWVQEQVTYVECEVFDRYSLAAGARVTGPALIEEAESTFVLGPSDIGVIDEHRNLVVELANSM